MDREGAQGWLDRYVAAWRSYDREEVAGLFTADVAYRYHPYDEPVTGRDAVVASWLGEGAAVEGASERDAPGTYDAHYAPVAVDGDTVVATGRSTYRETPGGPVTEVFHNCFVIRFGADGRCRELTEYFMQEPSRSAP
jgi:SnoaL-like protein